MTIPKIPKIRVCKDCECVKNIDQYPTNRHKTLSYRHRCKDCERIAKIEQNRRYYNKIKINKMALVRAT